ncbi:MAG: hypothetical protein R3D59_15130 [Paracoccaceae bacterium]
MFARVSHKLNKMRRERERNRRYGAAFNPAARERLLLVTLPERIPGSQVFPFHFYREALRGIHGADISEVHLDAFLSGETTVTGATVVAFQTEYDLDEALRDRILARIRETSPGARVVYLDWFAPTDLRFAALLGPHVDLYVKKHVLRDRSQYGQETFGDTNLMDYYGRANGLDHSPVRFPIPDGFLDKLVVGPSFATADFILPTLDRAELPKGPRPIDLHARIAVGGTPWYQTMRAQCHEASVALTQVRRSSTSSPAPASATTSFSPNCGRRRSASPPSATARSAGATTRRSRTAPSCSSRTCHMSRPCPTSSSPTRPTCRCAGIFRISRTRCASSSPTPTAAPASPRTRSTC